MHTHFRKSRFPSHLCLAACFASLLLLGWTADPSRAAPEWRLADEGEARALIATGENPGPVVRFAAEELKRKLDAITGASFDIVEQPPGGDPAVVLGDQPATREAGIDVATLKRDGYVIETRGNRLFIAGRDAEGRKAEKLFDLLEDSAVGDRGRNRIRRQYNRAQWDFERATLFGVYDFLRRLGARWFFPGPHGEVLPDRPTLAVEPMRIREEPAFELRALGVHSYKMNMGFAHYEQRAIFQAVEWTPEADKLFSIRQRGSTKWLAFNHRPKRHQWEKRFGESNPEYFALLENGKRDLDRVQEGPGHRPHLCYTIDGTFRETIRDIEAFFSGESARSRGLTTDHPDELASNNGWNVNVSYGDTFSLLPQDGFNVCQHEACQELVNPDASYGRRHNDLIWQFVERVAEEIRPRFPEKYVTCLGYSSYATPPESIDRLPDNVIVGAMPDISGRFWTYGNGDNRETYIDELREWDEKTAGPLLTWTNEVYRHKRPQRAHVPMTLPHHYADFARIWREHNVEWAYFVFEQDDPFMSHLRRYLWHRLLWSPDADVDAIVEDYVAKLYGPAASPMGRMIDDILERCRAIAEEEVGQVGIWSEHLTAKAMSQYESWLEQAKRDAAGTPHAEKAVELFDRFFLGSMRKGRDWYERNIASVMDSEAAQVTARQAWEPITVDGRLAEDVWKLSDRIKPFRSNETGEPTAWGTEARVLFTDESLYVALVCEDPNAPDRRVREGIAGDVVEVFLDPQHNHSDYYQVMVDMAGGIVADNYRSAPGEPIDESWDSGADAAVERHEDRWVVELAIPRERMKAGEVTPGARDSDEAERPWGFNVCRTMSHPPRKADKYSNFSPLLRGGFHQPDLFAHLFFD